ncbi:uncharacterized protein DNG_08663 [Cephalotrichum gorgonifer]|uniref:Spindle pole body component n=1 Tax=Cephalotrichum gorgonifer TaxID=2041049 RepID=A0AAE8N5P1_9PEZI|nr:uncharacterized protein DNG_08663 [Cephalotrichum gorgonifer]
MAINRDDADVFSVPDLWGSSSWQKAHPDPEEPSSFFSLDVTEIESRLKLNSILADRDGFFRQLTLETKSEHEAALSDEPTTEPSSDSDIPLSDDTDSIIDQWILDEPHCKTPDYKTWDTFNVPDAPRPEALCITEAGATVYDALLSEDGDPLNLKNTDYVVVDAKAYMAALLAVTVGRESVFFGLHSPSKSFKPVLPKIRISGHSADVLRGLQDMSIKCGGMFRRLRRLVESTYARHATPARVALASALDAVLSVIESSVAVHSRKARSLLQLQAAIRDISSILYQFDRLVDNLRPSLSDEAILLVVFRHAMSAEHKDVFVRDSMREVLQRVSRPWLNFMEEWLGVRPESGIPLTKNNVGQRRCFVKVEAETYIDDFGQEVEDVDFRLDRDSVPEFIPDDIAQKLFETGRSLRFIRSCHPDHPLSAQESVTRNNPPQAEWLYDWDSILELERRVSEYQANLSATISQARAENRTERGPSSALGDDPASYELQIFGADTSHIELHIMSSMKELAQPLQEQNQRDKLKEIIRARLSRGSGVFGDSSLEFSPHRSLLPALSFGPIVSAHGRIVNRESLRLLFTAHDLRGHIQLQRQFHLFGNGMFASRLSHALFDPDLETAERQQGVARRGGVMGLRLSGRDNWPPASSELRLALMGILAESHLPGSPDGVRDLPGDMSFGVRDMAPEDVDKCMDQDSLEALDFLRLTYKPPAALASIMTPVTLIQYDRIFKLMLRVLRLLYVTNRLFQAINSRACRWYTLSNPAVRFCFEARHLVHAVSSYFVDVGISMTWEGFESWLDKVQGEVTGDGDNDPLGELPGGTCSPERLRASHSLVLDHIMHALLLRKRQQPVLKLLEEIFGCILQFAKRIREYDAAEAGGSSGSGPEVVDLYGTFKKKVGVFITVCRGLNEKGDMGLRKGAKEGTEEVLGRQAEGNSIGYLLTRLDMFDYYEVGPGY